MTGYNKYMARLDAHSLDESLGAGDVSRAWLVWSSAAETALADAYRFAAGHVPERGLIMRRGTARLRKVRLGPMVRKVRMKAAVAHEGGDVFMYRDSCAAPLLDLRRRFKAVMNVLDATIRDGFSLARSVELAAQWDEFLRVRAGNPGTLEDFQLAWSGLGECRLVVGGIFVVGLLISFVGLLFTVGMMLFVGGGTGHVRILLFILISGSGLIWSPLLHFSSVSLT